MNNIFLDDVVKHFGVLKSPLDEDATYILPDGKVMSTSNGTKSQHENVAEFITEQTGENDLDENNGSIFMNNINAIRVTPWMHAFYLPERRITKAQENVLSEMIMKMKISYDEPLMVSSLDGMEFAEFNNENIADIFDCIKGFYAYGILTQY